MRVSTVLKANGLKKGNVVGLLVNNCPQLPALWLGNARLGGITPLINTNQRGNALIHSINVAKCDILIFSEEYQAGMNITKNLLLKHSFKWKYFCLGGLNFLMILSFIWSHEYNLLCNYQYCKPFFWRKLRLQIISDSKLWT